MTAVRREEVAIAPMMDELLEKRIQALTLESKLPSRNDEHVQRAQRIENQLLEFLPRDRVSRDPKILIRHGKDLTWHAFSPPDIVAYPNNVDEVSRILKLCNEHRFPVIPFGKGSSLDGHILAPFGGLSLDMRYMNRIISFSPLDGICVAEPGVTRSQLNNAVRSAGYFLGVDPGADASLGGMAATGAGGPTALRYGTMQNVVRGVQVVLADGRVIQTGSLAYRSCAGYDLNSLFVGSEGTLGVITQLTLSLSRAPEAIRVVRCVFPKGKILSAIKAVQELMQINFPALVRCEFLDEWSIEAVNRDQGRSYSIAPTLFLEFHADDAEYLDRVIEKARKIAVSNEVGAVQLSDRESETPEQTWSARYVAWYAIPQLREGTEAFATDVAVPMSELKNCVESALQIAKDEGIEMLPIIGHVGVANFHTFVLVDMKNAQEVEKAKRFNRKLMMRAQELRGTCTGEHGIGIGKRKELIQEVGRECVEVQCAIKRALDPRGILNPGKIFQKKMMEEGGQSRSIAK